MPQSPADAPSTLRSIRWNHPRVAYPAPIELALSRALGALDKPRGEQWRALFVGAPVPGKVRERRKRRDGAVNVVSVLCTMIAAGDLVRGLVATPAGDRWERKSWTDIDALAFGPLVPGERSLRRTERAAAELEAQGFVRSVPWRVVTSDGVRSIPGLKFVTDKAWKALGVWSAVVSERRRRKQREADARKAQLDEAIGGSVKRMPERGRTSGAGSGAATSRSSSTPPPATAGPVEAGEAAAAAMQKLKDFFSKG